MCSAVVLGGNKCGNFFPQYVATAFGEIFPFGGCRKKKPLSCDGKQRRVEVSPQAGVQGARGGQVKDGRSQRNGGLFIARIKFIMMGYGAFSN